MIKMNMDRDKLLLIGKIFLIIFALGLWTYSYIDFNVMFNNDKVTLWIHGPSIVEEDEEFSLTVEAWDIFERLAGRFTGEISFSIESYNFTTLEGISSDHTLPADYVFSSNFIWSGILPAYIIPGADNGKKTFNMKISTPGIHYVVVEEKNNHNRYRSNPIIVKSEGDSYLKLYWGDLHGHTLFSDGSGLPFESYQIARDVSLLDFAALTDHCEHFPRMGDIDIFNIFDNYIQTTNSFNEPEKFVTIVALEWTPRYVVRGADIVFGHLNVYFEGDNMPFFSTFTNLTPDVLFEYLEENSNDDFISWTHHTIRKDYASDYAFYHEDINTLIEIYSVHGSCETLGNDTYYEEVSKIPTDEPGYSVRDALKMGRRFGFMASGDTHDGRLGHSISHTKASAYNQYPYTLAGYRLGHPHPNGLTGIFASNLTRKSIFNALKTKSCLATTGVNRPYIEFNINETTVGDNNSTLNVPANDTHRRINILICADGVSFGPNNINNISEVEIYKNSELWYSNKSINDIFFKMSILDNKTITGTSYDNCIQKDDGEWYIHQNSLKPVNPDELNTGGFDYYYIRTRDTSGYAAWVGPIWVGVP